MSSKPVNTGDRFGCMVAVESAAIMGQWVTYRCSLCGMIQRDTASDIMARVNGGNCGCPGCPNAPPKQKEPTTVSDRERAERLRRERVAIDAARNEAEIIAARFAVAEEEDECDDDLAADEIEAPKRVHREPLTAAEEELLRFDDRVDRLRRLERRLPYRKPLFDDTYNGWDNAVRAIEDFPS